MKILQVHNSHRVREPQFQKEKNDKNSYEIPWESGKSTPLSTFVVFQPGDLGYPSIPVIPFAKVY